MLHFIPISVNITFHLTAVYWKNTNHGDEAFNHATFVHYYWLDCSHPSSHPIATIATDGAASANASGNTSLVNGRLSRPPLSVPHWLRLFSSSCLYPPLCQLYGPFNACLLLSTPFPVLDRFYYRDLKQQTLGCVYLRFSQKQYVLLLWSSMLNFLYIPVVLHGCCVLAFPACPIESCAVPPVRIVYVECDLSSMEYLKNCFSIDEQY